VGHASFITLVKKHWPGYQIQAGGNIGPEETCSTEHIENVLKICQALWQKRLNGNS